jgi:hypothetical protein
MEHWCDHGRGVAPLKYIAMIGFDAPRLGLPASCPARALSPESWSLRVLL